MGDQDISLYDLDLLDIQGPRSIESLGSNIENNQENVDKFVKLRIEIIDSGVGIS